ncbi:MAG: hypothetical protein M0D57_08845 [Sphingobacteriales bacterium JAD_PAG50586_3]|nr:MAG: hypothetical protein M0D57_08845 [Sphingobacteriales bacterium JAD_PAG50586_3]
MKKFLLVSICLIFTFFAGAQVNGDFRSRITGNWGTAATWERYNGSTWATSTVIPASSAANNGNVTIQDGHTVTVAALVSQGVTSLTVGGYKWCIKYWRF